MSEVRYACAAAASFGLEAVVRAELGGLGISETRAEDMRVLFEGSAKDIARCNIGLRTADRVLIRLADFPAGDFDAVYEGVRAVPWRDLLAPDPLVVVQARSVKSRLSATRPCSRWRRRRSSTRSARRERTRERRYGCDGEDGGEGTALRRGARAA